MPFRLERIVGLCQTDGMWIAYVGFALKWNYFSKKQRVSTFQRNNSPQNIKHSHVSSWCNFWTLTVLVPIKKMRLCKLFTFDFHGRKKIILVRTEVLGELPLKKTHSQESPQGSYLNYYFSLKHTYRQKWSTLKILFHVGMKNILPAFFLLNRTPATTMQKLAEKDNWSFQKLSL